MFRVSEEEDEVCARGLPQVSGIPMYGEKSRALKFRQSLEQLLGLIPCAGPTHARMISACKSAAVAPHSEILNGQHQFLHRKESVTHIFLV